MKHGRVDTEYVEASLGDGDQFLIDIDPHECTRRKTRRKHRQRDPASTADLQNPLSLRQRERANQERDLDPFLQPIPRFHVAERDVVLLDALGGRDHPRGGTLAAGLGRRRRAGATFALEAGWHECSYSRGRNDRRSPC